jgi:SAM-dependent methyltransferase
MKNAEQMHSESLKSWDSIAPGWQRQSDFIFASTRPVSEWMVERLDPKPGQTILELASGPGDTGFLAARKLGDGRLISTDFAPGMVEVARQRAKALGVTNVEHRVMDAQKMDLADDSVDGVLCRFGLMLMIDPSAALRETRRVLRNGGRLAAAVWGPPPENPWLVIPGMVLAGMGLTQMGAPDEPGGVFSLADEEKLKATLADSGFDQVTVEAIPTLFKYGELDDWYQRALDTSGALADALRALTPEQAEEVKRAVADATPSYKTSSGYELPGLALGVSAAS